MTAHTGGARRRVAHRRRRQMSSFTDFISTHFCVKTLIKYSSIEKQIENKDSELIHKYLTIASASSAFKNIWQRNNGFNFIL